MKLHFKITSRHAASTVAVAASLYFSFSQLHNERVRQERDLEIGAVVLTDALREAAEPLLKARDMARLKLLVEQFGRRGRLAGTAVYDDAGELVAATRSLQPRLGSVPATVARCLSRDAEANGYETLDGSRVRVEAMPLHRIHGAGGAIAVFHDTGFIEARENRSRVQGALRMAAQAALFLLAVWLFGLLFD